MIASRTVTRAAARSLRTPIRTQARRCYASETTSTAAKAGGSSGFAGGLAGGALVFIAGYGYYHFSGAKSIVNAASTTKTKFQQVTKNLQDSAPEPNEALKWFRSTATSYAAFIPGAKGYVDTAFNDLDSVQQKHGKEVDKIVNDAYADLKKATKGGLDMETASKSWEIVQNTIKKLGELAGDSMNEILDHHPEIKEKVGGNLDQLKSMAESYGPEAKKEVEKTYSQISDVIKGGISVDTISKIQKVVNDTTQRVQKLGDEAWKKGMEQAKPYLDKKPEIKKFIEENAETLKKGNMSEVWSKVSKAVESGNMDDLKDYAKQAGKKAKESGLGQGIEQYIKMVPGGSEMLPRLKKMQEVATERGDEAQEIVKKAFEDVQNVLQKRTKEIEDLADKAKKEAK